MSNPHQVALFTGSLITFYHIIIRRDGLPPCSNIYWHRNGTPCSQHNSQKLKPWHHFCQATCRTISAQRVHVRHKNEGFFTYPAFSICNLVIDLVQHIYAFICRPMYPYSQRSGLSNHKHKYINPSFVYWQFGFLIFFTAWTSWFHMQGSVHL